jgi:molybdopterin-guanine dinucleotide biosynthesis protein
MRRRMVMLGETYDIPEEHKDAIVEGFKKSSVHKAAMDHHAHRMKEESDASWATITAVIPEIDARKFMYDYDYENQVIRCRRKVRSDY